jgi:hypothetical protein
MAGFILAGFILPISAVLRRADEHLDKVIMQRIVELALETPLELGMVEIARMQIEGIGMDWDSSILELDDDFDAFAFGAGGEVQQGMFVKLELREDAVETGIGGFGHAVIVVQTIDLRGTTLSRISKDCLLRCRAPKLDESMLETPCDADNSIEVKGILRLRSSFALGAKADPRSG